MHIVYLSPTFLPHRGRSEQVISEWASRLSRRHKITIITLRWKDEPYRSRVNRNVTCYRLPAFDIPIVGHVLRAGAILLTLLGISVCSRIDILHLCHVYHMGFGAVLYKHLTGIPMVNTLLGYDTYDPISPISPRIFPFISFVMNSAEKVVTMTSHMAASARKQGAAGHITIIPHGSSIRDRSSTVSIRGTFNIHENKRLVFSLQRLFPRKDVSTLLKSVPLVLECIPEAHFIIGGTGPELPVLEQLVREMQCEDNVVFVGFIPDEDLASYYEQCEVFALSTLYEGFGVVYVDCLSKGLPIVTTAQGGALDIINEECGILVEPGNPRAFAQGIIRALNHHWDTGHIIELSEKYNWRKIVNEYSDIYSLLRTSRSSNLV